MALPLEELLPKEGVLAVLVKVVAAEDVGEVLNEATVFLLGYALRLIALLHLLDEGLQQLGVLLREVRLFLAAALVVHIDEGRGGLHEGGGAAGAGDLESSAKCKHFLSFS